MAKKLRQPPSVSERLTPRGQEYFFADLSALLGLVGERTTDVGSIAAGAIGSFTVAVTGARPDVGMTVQVGVPSAINTGLVAWGNVTADDEVTVYLYNRTGSPIDPVSATYSVRVMP